MHLKGDWLPLKLQKGTFKEDKDFSVVELYIQSASISGQEENVPAE